MDFDLWTHVVHLGPERYLARVMAIPHGIPTRCAPEERKMECASEAEAREAARRLLEDLGRDVRSRGNRTRVS